MSKTKSTKACVDDLNLIERRQFLRGMCPCRTNSSDDLEGWRELFTRARFGSISERRAAAHSIGTLLEKAHRVDAYRELLVELQSELDALMADPRAASQVLGVLKKHGHAHKGAARKNYRKAYSLFTMQSPAEVASWLNNRMTSLTQPRVTANSKVVQNLSRWLKHRVTFQPARKTTEDELVKKARQLAPALFA